MGYSIETMSPRGFSLLLALGITIVAIQSARVMKKTFIAHWKAV